LRDAIVEVKKPLDRNVPERFGEWEARITWWQQVFGKDRWRPPDN